jgi:hypothetical protein
MGLVQNLKKTLKNMVGKILVELSSHYIKQRAKQISKRQDNSLRTMSLRNRLTTEPQRSTIATSSQGTSEKIIMETATEEIVGHVYQWAMDRIETMTKSKPTDDQFKDAMAIAGEFEEWIDSKTLGMEDIEIMSIERY